MLSVSGDTLSPCSLVRRTSHCLTDVVITATPVLASRRSRPDTAACYPAVKAAIHGLVDGGVIAADDPSHLVELTFAAPVVGAHDALVLVVTPVEVDIHTAAVTQ